MPTLQDETLPQRYAREHQDYLKLCGSMTAEQVADLQLQLHSALAAATTPPQPIYDEAKERELFEVYYRAEFEGNTGNELSDADIKSMRDGPWYGESRHYLNGQWAGWKACAQSRAKAGEAGHE